MAKKIIDRLPLCATCLHFRHEVRDSESCAAFPLGIPKSILTWRADHRKPVKDDHGIRYEKSVV